MSLDEGADVLTKGILFWINTIESLSIKNISYCDELLEQLQQHLVSVGPQSNGNCLYSQDKDASMNMILALGFKFWISVI